ncbi:MAG: hypothetical protein LBC68_08100 [Prevotellaceae bacterium]|jgi:hypothetical protein|nr:hypothetical protein [Prevotellaceae bacterium]
MTYREWITATTSKFQMEQADVDLILVNQNSLIPNPDDDVDVTKAKTALCKEFAMLIPLTNVTEGGYSLYWNWNAIKFWYNQTCAELGIIPADKPRIKNKSYVW